LLFVRGALDIRERNMASGKVKWWDNTRGFGFICQEDGQDVFVHHTAVLGKGFKVLHEGDEVVFDLVASEKGPKALNVQRPQAS
jgi:CspA family cold shock protein